MSLTDAMSDLCALIERTAHAEHARHLHDTTTPSTGQVVALPMWAWVEPQANLGRKQDRADLFPVRVHWDGDLVRHHNGEPLRWHINGLGVVDEGTHDPHTGTGLPPNTPTPVVADHDHLKHLIVDGEHAQWDFLQLLEQITAAALEDHHRQLMREYSLHAHGDPDHPPRAILHPEKIDALRLHLVYGDGTTEPPLMRVIRGSWTQDFTNVEPQRWARQWVRKIARDHLHSAAGEDRAGPRIRRMARDLDTDDPEVIAAALNGVGVKRVRAALSLRPHPDAATIRLAYYQDDPNDDWLHSQLAR